MNTLLVCMGTTFIGGVVTVICMLSNNPEITLVGVALIVVSISVPLLR
jgi:hypothetical protein